MSADLAKENPYVAIATKKHRNLKKKMEKIVKIEQMLAAGKQLDQEQIAVLQSKKSVEKALQDVAALKAQLEEVAKAQLEESLGKSPQPLVEERADDEVVNYGGLDAEHTLDATTANATANNHETANVETNNELEFHSRHAAEAAAAEVAQANEAKRRVELEEKVNKLVKALHVYQRYKEVTNRPLPDNVDYFGRTLLGGTTLSGFHDTLQHSARVAGYYLIEDLAVQNEMVRGCNYVQMEHLINTLADEMEKIPPNRTGPSGTLTALLRNTISSPAPLPSEPTINVPPVPHIPPVTDHAVEISPTKFDLPAPQPVPQFVSLEPNFGTLQFGAVSTPAVVPAAVAPASSNNSGLTYATINFAPSPEPFFQLAPPSVAATSAPAASSVPHRHEPVHHEVVPAPMVETAPVSVEQIHATESTDTAGDDGNNLSGGENNNKSEGEGDNNKAEGGDAAGGRKRNNNRNRNRKNRGEGGENTNNTATTTSAAVGAGGSPGAGEGGEKGGRGKRNNDRFNKDKKDGNNNTNNTNNNANEEGGEGNKGGFQKKRSFNRESGEGGGAAAAVKEYNWTKKVNNKENNKGKADGNAAATASEPAQKQPEAASTPAPEKDKAVEHVAAPVATKVEAVAASEPVAAASTSKPHEVVEAPKAEAPVKRSSYLDAVRPGAAASSAPAATADNAKADDHKPARKPFHHKDNHGNKEAEGGGESNNRPRRDRSNNRVPREGGGPEGEKGESKGHHQEGEKRPFSNRDRPAASGGAGGDRPQGERKPFPRNNSNNNNTNNNYNNNKDATNNKPQGSRTVNNNSQTVRRPAPSTKTEGV